MSNEDNPSSNPSTTETDPSRDERLEAINKILRKLVGPYLDIQAEGFKRIQRLLSVAERINNEPSVQSILAGENLEHDAAQDILRAAVVLIHAHLEEYLRTMSAVLLPEADETCLNEIPIAGGGGRKEKFLLGKLVQHKGKLVDDLLRDSVFEYLERSNYNSTEEIARLLETLGFKVSEHNKFFPEIQQMIERRHQIVHRADFFDGGSITSLQPISLEDVARWSSATHELMYSLISPLLQKLSALEVKKPSAKSKNVDLIERS